MARVYFSYAASGNPHLSYGKVGRALEGELATICDPVTDPATADLQLYLGIPHYPQRALWSKRAARALWFTMWEAPVVPRSFVARINNWEGMMTPSTWCGRTFRASGVTVPMAVVPLGYDPAIYRPKKDPARPFTFLWVGVTSAHHKQLRDGRPFGDRKRGWMVRKAFLDLDLPGSRLVVKSIPWPSFAADFSYHTRSGRATVREFSAFISEAEMADLYRSADVLVWPTRGEGWGLPPIEAAACGTPTILPNYSSMTDYFDPAWCIGLPFAEDYCPGSPREQLGAPIVGARVEMDDLKAAMLWAYENRDVVRQMGARGAEAVQRWTWARATRPALRTALQEHIKEAA